MRAAGVVLLIAAVAMFAAPYIAQARRNRRARQARIALAGAASWLDALVEEALVEGVQDDPIYQRLCFERWQKQIDGVA